MLHRPGRLLLFLMDRLWQILRFVLLAVFVTVLLLGLVIKPMYHFADYPYFTAVSWRDLLGRTGTTGDAYGEIVVEAAPESSRRTRPDRIRPGSSDHFRRAP